MPRKKHKIDLYDARRIQEALGIMKKVAEYNYVCESNPLYRKLDTICRKMENLLNEDLEDRIQDAYRKYGRV